MKHLLNNLSEEEKNAIREQHVGGMKVMVENFRKLTNSKLGDVKTLVEANSQFKATAVVEDDMYMDFPVKDIQVVNGKVMMTFTDPTDNKLLFVIDFYGPIYDRKTKAKVYQDSSFQNINGKNYQQVAKTHGIPMLKPMS
jgi:hypothetical protein